MRHHTSKSKSIDEKISPKEYVDRLAQINLKEKVVEMKGYHVSQFWAELAEIMEYMVMGVVDPGLAVLSEVAELGRYCTSQFWGVPIKVTVRVVFCLSPVSWDALCNPQEYVGRMLAYHKDLYYITSECLVALPSVLSRANGAMRGSYSGPAVRCGVCALFGRR